MQHRVSSIQVSFLLNPSFLLVHVSPRVMFLVCDLLQQGSCSVWKDLVGELVRSLSCYPLIKESVLCLRCFYLGVVCLVLSVDLSVRLPFVNQCLAARVVPSVNQHLSGLVLP